MKPRLFFCAWIFLLGFFTMADQAARPAGSDLFAQLRAATSRVPGWTEKTDQYRSFTAKQLYDIIDGGAVEHEKQGLKRGIGLLLTNNNNSLDIYFEDFGSPSRARGMVGVKKKLLSDPKKIPRVRVAPAIYEEVIGGCVAYWAKGRFYVEMTLTGYDSLGNAVRDAAALVDTISPAMVK